MLSDPDNGDYSLLPQSPAQGYGCQTFGRTSSPKTALNKHFSSNSSHTNNRELIEVSGSLFTDTYWDADTISVIGDIIIEDNVTLDIAPGTSIIFQDYYKFEVKGSIFAIGVPENNIAFTYYDTHAFSLDTLTTGAWAGIHFNQTESQYPSIFKYCKFEYSKGVQDNKFGGVFSLYNFSNLTVENSIFQYNVANYGGVFSFQYNSNPNIINNLFINNYSLTGGNIIYCTYSHPKIISNTIISNNNVNPEISYPTAAIDTYISKPLLVNNILWNNYTNYYQNLQLLNCKPYYVHHNIILDGYEGENNYNMDPLLGGDTGINLEPNSPAINAGNSPIHGIDLPETDIFGNYRFMEYAIDIGASEFQGMISHDDEIMTSPYSIICYPNPLITGHNRNSLQIRIEGIDVDELTELTIFDLRGRRFKEFNIASLSKNLSWNLTDENGSPAKSGIYLIKAKSKNNKTVAAKSIIIH